MGSIRMVMLDGLAVADLLALRSGGFFEGATVQLPSTDGRAGVQLPATNRHPGDQGPLPGSEVTGTVTVPAGMLKLASVTPAPKAAPTPEPAPLPVEQQAALAEVQAELAAYRAEKGAGAPQDARTEATAGIDPTPAPVAAPAAPTATGPVSPAQLAGFAKFRDVLQLLLDAGMAPGDLTAYLESVKGEVPLLQRIPDIGERVTRTLSVMGLGG